MKDKIMSAINDIFARLSTKWPTGWSIEPNDGFIGLGFERGPFYLGGKFDKEGVDELIEYLEKSQKTL